MAIPIILGIVTRQITADIMAMTIIVVLIIPIITVGAIVVAIMSAFPLVPEAIILLILPIMVGILTGIRLPTITVAAIVMAAVTSAVLWVEWS